MLQQPLTPIIIEVIDKPTRETTVADVLLQAIGLAGAFVLLALVAGLLAGGVFIAMRILRPRNSFNGEASDVLRLGLDPFSTLR